MSKPITSLEYHRRAAELTLDELAQASQVSKVQLSRYENGHRIPTLATAHKIGDALAVAPDLLFPRRGRWGPMQILEAWYTRQAMGTDGSEYAMTEEERDMERAEREQAEEGEEREALHRRRMAQADEEARTGGDPVRRNAYYRRQDPSTYRPLTFIDPEGRTIREEVPNWFAARMPNAGRGGKSGRPAGRSPRRRSSSRGSPDDEPGPKPSAAPHAGGRP